MRQVLFFILLQQIGHISLCDLPYVPCPDLFQYIYDGKAWFAQITVPTPPPHSQKMVLSLNFSVQDIGLSNYGKISLYDKPNVLQDIRNRRPIKYKVTLPKWKYLPQITEINYNGDILCSGPGLGPPSTHFWLTYTLNWHSSSSSIPHSTHPPPIFTTAPPYFTPKPTPSSNNIFYPTPSSTYYNKFTNYQNCGTIRNRRTVEDPDVIPFIYNGTAIPRNAHPWLAAMYDTEKGPLNFFCGGNLISNKHVLTAAHCTIVKRTIKVKVGAHNTREAFEQGALFRDVKSITNHPEYSHGSAHADISILLLSDHVEFISTIKPICLWNMEKDLNAVVGVKGTIMGWGLTEDGGSSSTPLQTDVAIAAQQVCKSVEPLKNSISDMTFCAGTKGTGPCLGDSGGGLLIKRDGRWYLRGIISTSVADKRLQICDVNTYAVYVDTAKYMDWIIDNMH